MNILVHPQISMRSYDDGKWLITKDSQMNKLLGYFRNMREHKFVVLVPEADRVDDLSQIHEVGAHTMAIPWTENVQQGRYHFDVNTMRTHLPFDVDLLLLEVPELARNWRAVLDAEHQGRVPIISVVNHADVFTWSHTFGKSGALMRQLDGAVVSDATVFHVRGTQDAWLRAAGALLSDAFLREHVVPKLHLWPGSFDMLEMPFGVKSEQEPLAVNFISRLSDNSRTHFAEFFDAVDLMKRANVDFQAWVGDPNEASMDRVPPWITRQGPWSREQYFSYLWESSVVPILWPQWEMHSLGACHAIATENILVSPAPADGYSMPGVHVSGEITGGKLAEALKYALNLEGEERYMVIAEQHSWLRTHRSIQDNLDAARSTIDRVMDGV